MSTVQLIYCLSTNPDNVLGEHRLNSAEGISLGRLMKPTDVHKPHYQPPDVNFYIPLSEIQPVSLGCHARIKRAAGGWFELENVGGGDRTVRIYERSLKGGERVRLQSFDYFSIGVNPDPVCANDPYFICLFMLQGATRYTQMQPLTLLLGDDEVLLYHKVSVELTPTEMAMLRVLRDKREIAQDELIKAVWKTDTIDDYLVENFLRQFRTLRSKLRKRDGTNQNTVSTPCFISLKKGKIRLHLDDVQASLGAYARKT